MGGGVDRGGGEQQQTPNSKRQAPNNNRPEGTHVASLEPFNLVDLFLNLHGLEVVKLGLVALKFRVEAVLGRVARLLVTGRVRVQSQGGKQNGGEQAAEQDTMREKKTCAREDGGNLTQLSCVEEA